MNDLEKQRPVVAGLVEHTAEGPQLLGSRCANCRTVYFPSVATCRNPDCESGSADATVLSRHGALYSFTIQRYKPPPLFRMDDWAPYAIGLVELPEGIRVMGILTGVELDDIRIGESYVLASAALFRDEDGREVYTHVFERELHGGAA